MNRRRPLIRKVLRKQRRQTDNPITRSNITHILRDNDLLDAVASYVEDEIEETLYGEEEDGPIIRFIKWCIENPEKLAKFLAMLIAIFAEGN